MKKSVNRNIFAADILLGNLAASGLKQVNISPGSRSTPLVFAADKLLNLNKSVIIDERASGFAALGYAKSASLPAVIITTSGTAVSNLYPAVTEAFMTRIPMLIITADRPPRLYNTGANQTINQRNLFANHIRASFNIYVHDLTEETAKHIKETAHKAWNIATTENPGPVHINISFDKPFEPDSFTDETDFIIADYISASPPVQKECDIIVADDIISSRLMIYIGGGAYTDEEQIQLNTLSVKTNSPVFVDGTAVINKSFKNRIFNFSDVLRNKKDWKVLTPDVVYYFGKAPTLNQLTDFLSYSDSRVVQVNSYGDNNDPSLSDGKLFECSITEFCEIVKNSVSPDLDNSYLKCWQSRDNLISDLKTHFLKNADWKFEGKLLGTILQRVISDVPIFIGNSMPVRDLDVFCSRINAMVYTNRGASGIDGNIATTAGLSLGTGKPAVLILGDVSFIHDSSSLLYIKQLKLDVLVIVINNSGGKIFDMLPVSAHSSVMDKYFYNKPDVKISDIALVYTSDYYLAETEKQLLSMIEIWNKKPAFTIIEVTTSSVNSAELRKKLSGSIQEKSAKC